MCRTNLQQSSLDLSKKKIKLSWRLLSVAILQLPYGHCSMLYIGENILLQDELLRPRHWQVINERFLYGQFLKPCKVTPRIAKNSII